MTYCDRQTAAWSGGAHGLAQDIMGPDPRETGARGSTLGTALGIQDRRTPLRTDTSLEGSWLSGEEKFKVFSWKTGNFIFLKNTLSCPDF